MNIYIFRRCASDYSEQCYKWIDHAYMRVFFFLDAYSYKPSVYIHLEYVTCGQ